MGILQWEGKFSEELTASVAGFDLGEEWDAEDGCHADTELKGVRKVLFQLKLLGIGIWGKEYLQASQHEDGCDAHLSSPARVIRVSIKA